MTKFTIEQTVYRLENREITEAVVKEINAEDEHQIFYRIEYVEGGFGWWPEDCLTDKTH